jgi:hypothetical protein
MYLFMRSSNVLSMTSLSKVTETICEHIRSEALQKMLGAQTMHGLVSNFWRNPKRLGSELKEE